MLGKSWRTTPYRQARRRRHGRRLRSPGQPPRSRRPVNEARQPSNSDTMPAQIPTLLTGGLGGAPRSTFSSALVRAEPRCQTGSPSLRSFSPFRHNHIAPPPQKTLPARVNLKSERRTCAVCRPRVRPFSILGVHLSTNLLACTTSPPDRTAPPKLASREIAKHLAVRPEVPERPETGEAGVEWAWPRPWSFRSFLHLLLSGLRAGRLCAQRIISLIRAQSCTNVKSRAAPNLADNPNKILLLRQNRLRSAGCAKLASSCASTRPSLTAIGRLIRVHPRAFAAQYFCFVHSPAQTQNPDWRRTPRITPTNYYHLDKIGFGRQATRSPPHPVHPPHYSCVFVCIRGPMFFAGLVVHEVQNLLQILPRLALGLLVVRTQQIRRMVGHDQRDVAPLVPASP
jgi:hypothetical protein